MVDEAQQAFQEGYPNWPLALDNNTGMRQAPHVYKY